MINLAAAVTVTAKQRPVIAEDPAQPGCDHILASHSGLEDLLPIGCSLGPPERARDSPPLAPQRNNAPQPRPPPVLSTSLIPCLPRLLDPQVMLCQRALELSLGPLPGGQAALGGILKHRARMIRQLNYPHGPANCRRSPSSAGRCALLWAL